MPELPEVEVSRMGISPHLIGQTIKAFVFRTPKLRWDIPQELKQLEGQVVRNISRRAKYLLIETDKGTAIVHLGMSGSLRVLDADFPAAKHDHVDLKLTNGKVLRYNDPRRFGAWLWCALNESHAVLEHMGPEPLTEEFNADYVAERAKGKRVAIKQFIMDNKVVVGVGNIYANESLFKSRIHPTRPAGKLSIKEWQLLVENIKATLEIAIQQGGTTLKDFAQADGKPGYFAQELQVYGKAGEPCPECGEALQEQKIGQRNTFFCGSCQK
ncbi:8-dihydro-8-oxoguanine (8-oxoG). Has AP (apurinic apyrimidinic) lyase activity and introduces nicks in the DNA strand. Cleaves the DNA backbone by beta-delta elimination to generate a single-strand break at the site of the removed base with both 3'- and 5'-phosphates [Vibrio sp. B1REV9]|uniref:bifunctional DNA-formamidopyrimidine glycosylase/DNA-(apurinic or apyrimidinic site) lyase n=1 Tax=Vibrio sp. B1REV9 TaxID=2751179 RepID=UPI001AF04B70|nr:bifunctional DNA-formamidopyrimidine glycosylase/DNA-(apurinic or apyrimidinic site) lyase [Vibrio sp. B1REV9]CAE6881771.1 8-dihydro-8-oxoguanine (8-oxoG). Has AP (apurinic apyrimidinic) lyase activity and introduces nicks in the DNA strand. Cleaves the DNA backbone by beta-delta elimination to generate a single-strand break at the site of the removed base with both 3'- and 5'-phosphates [Vibrio sp. B1REV9]